VQTTVTSFAIVLQTTSGSYNLAGIQQSTSANGVPVCRATLATGADVRGGIVNIAVERGSEAQVIISGSESGVLFDGIVEDIVPGDFQFGAFSITVVILGKSAILASGTLQTSQLVPKSYLDTAVIWDVIQQMDGRYDLSYEGDFLANLKDVLIRIATDNEAPIDSTTLQLQEIFGATVNTRAAEQIARLQTSLMWSNALEDVDRTGIVASINTMFRSNWFYETFLNRIVNIGNLLYFSLLEASTRLDVVPFLPFAFSQEATTIRANEFYTVSIEPASFVNLNGCALTNGGNRDGKDTIAGVYQRPTQDPFGLVLVQPCPTSVFAGIPKARDVINRPRQATLVTEAVTNNLAQQICWTQSFEGRKVRVTCPTIRRDIGPMTAIEIRFPESREIAAGLETNALYGAVERVTIVADASKQFAATIYEVGYARSEQIQLEEIDGQFLGHPYWDSRCVRTFLDGRAPVVV